MDAFLGLSEQEMEALATQDMPPIDGLDGHDAGSSEWPDVSTTQGFTGHFQQHDMQDTGSKGPLHKPRIQDNYYPRPQQRHANFSIDPSPLRQSYLQQPPAGATEPKPSHGGNMHLSPYRQAGSLNSLAGSTYSNSSANAPNTPHPVDRQPNGGLPGAWRTGHSNAYHPVQFQPVTHPQILGNHNHDTEPSTATHPVNSQRAGHDCNQFMHPSPSSQSARTQIQLNPYASTQRPALNFGTPASHNVTSRQTAIRPDSRSRQDRQLQGRPVLPQVEQSTQLAAPQSQNHKAAPQVDDTLSDRVDGSLESKGSESTDEPQGEAHVAATESTDGDAWTVNSVEEARQLRYTRKPLTIPADDDDYSEVEQDISKQKEWIRRLTAAMRSPTKPTPPTRKIKDFPDADTHAEWNRWQTQHKTLVNKLLNDTDLKGEDVKMAWILLGEVLDTHKLGQRLTSGVTDRKSKFSVRMAKLEEVLTELPIIRVDVLLDITMHKLVANPHGYKKQKISNMWGNFRKALLEQQRKDVANADNSTAPLVKKPKTATGNAATKQKKVAKRQPRTKRTKIEGVEKEDEHNAPDDNTFAGPAAGSLQSTAETHSAMDEKPVRGMVGGEDSVADTSGQNELMDEAETEATSMTDEAAYEGMVEAKLAGRKRREQSTPSLKRHIGSIDGADIVE